MEEEEDKFNGAYVIDTNIFRPLFNVIYEDVFPEIWESVDELIELNKFCSVAEVRKEYDNQLSHRPESVLWAKDHSHLFLLPSAEDVIMLRKIYEIPEFRMKPKDIKNKKSHADGFVVAKAHVLNGWAITDESPTSHDPAKIPNICRHFNVNCMCLHDFLRILKNKEYLNE